MPGCGRWAPGEAYSSQDVTAAFSDTMILCFRHGDRVYWDKQDYVLTVIAFLAREMVVMWCLV